MHQVHSKPPCIIARTKVKEREREMKQLTVIHQEIGEETSWRAAMPDKRIRVVMLHFVMIRTGCELMMLSLVRGAHFEA
jgi:hypothetical protein